MWRGVSVFLAVLLCAAVARGEAVVDDKTASLDLMPRGLTSRHGLLVEPLHIDIDPRHACLTIWARAMLDVFDVADKLGCMVLALRDDLGELGQVLAVAVSGPLHLVTIVLNSAGRIGTMRVTIAPPPGAATPTTLSFAPAFVPSGGGLSLLGNF